MYTKANYPFPVARKKEVPYPPGGTSGTTTSPHAKNKKGPKPGEHVQLFRMKRDHNKGFYSHKC